MSKLLMARHGETTHNSRERFWGKTDVELSQTGIKEAEQLRDRLAKEKINAVYASSLKRATRTAEIIAGPHRLSVTSCPELAEIDFGEFEGLTFEEINQRFPDMAAQWANWNIPRFPEGESSDEFNARIKQFIPRLDKHKEDETLLIVAHAGTLRLLICDLMEIDSKHWRQLKLDLGSLSIIETYARGAILTRLNDVSHLK